MALLTLTGEHKEGSGSALLQAGGGMIYFLLGVIFWALEVILHMRGMEAWVLPALAVATALYVWYYHRVYLPRLLAFRDEAGEQAAIDRARWFALLSMLPLMLALVGVGMFG